MKDFSNGEVLPSGSVLNFFVLVRANSKNNKLTYTWSADKGAIISGQGTGAIFVSTDEYLKGKFNVDVEIGGLPEGCNNKLSGFAITYTQGSPFLLSSFGEMQSPSVRAYLDIAFNEISKDEKVDAYIISYGRQDDLIRIEKLIANHIKYRKVDLNRVNFYWGGNESALRTRIYLQPNVSDFPGEEGKDIRSMIRKIWAEGVTARSLAISGCPSVWISEPVFARSVGEDEIFSANVVGESDEAEIGYEWTVNRGRIIDGIGTSRITVSTKDIEDSTITASVKVTGFPKDCKENTVSGSGIVIEVPPLTFVDEFGAIAESEMGKRLGSYQKALTDDSGATGYIVNYGTAKAIEKREKLLRDSLIAIQGGVAPRIVFVNGGLEKTIRTRLWIVPAGADPSTVN